ncbi:MAG: YceI family protein [Rubrivivax sp.]
MKPALYLVSSLVVAAGLARAEPVTYQLDPTHTFVTFEALHRGLSTVRGRFDRKQGQVVLDREAKTGRVEVSFDTAAVSTGVAALDRRLQEPDFFASADHPQARFVADRVLFADGKPAEVTGELTLAGRTNPLTLKATGFNCYFNPLFKREVCGGDFVAVVRRSQWGLNFGLPDLVPDEIRLLVQVEGVKQ